MISIGPENFATLNNVKNYNQNLVIYNKVLDDTGINSLQQAEPYKAYASLGVGLSALTEKELSLVPISKKSGMCVCVFLQPEKIQLYNNIGEATEIVADKGSVFVYGSIFRENWDYTIPKSCMILYEENPLSYIYLSTEKRIDYSKKIKSQLQEIKNLPPWSQQVHNFVKNVSELGSGCYGYVYKGKISTACFAVKMSKIEDTSHNDINSADGSWHEIYIMEKILKPIVTSNICPNLPLLFDYYTCDKCSITLRGDERLNTPCVISVMELASGDLKKYLNSLKTIPDEEFLSILFQVMVALHAIQYYGQIMNFDVKKENILYYNVEPGGYWHYVVHGIDFYVPNYGKLFILNDFGISRPMSPYFQIFREDVPTFRLGHRLAVVMDGKFHPMSYTTSIDTDGKEEKASVGRWFATSKSRKTKIIKGGQFRLKRNTTEIIPGKMEISEEIKKFLKKKKISSDPENIDFYNHPEVIPPFEFYNDTQDMIRMFVGGKRTTQKGNHRACTAISSEIVKKLKSYLGPGESMKSMKFTYEPAQVLAGYFIVNFFDCFREKTEKYKLGTFVVSQN